MEDYVRNSDVDAKLDIRTATGEELEMLESLTKSIEYCPEIGAIRMEHVLKLSDNNRLLKTLQKMLRHKDTWMAASMGKAKADQDVAASSITLGASEGQNIENSQWVKVKFKGTSIL
jgi:hypothetical protein